VQIVYEKPNTCYIFRTRGIERRLLAMRRAASEMEDGRPG
jgi:hypothetical protein